ncbi:DUF6338 family protein [Curtobacterium sp. MCBA15_008]|uniref:DUF6338 family protein n=1 Tax=Curtobacterium sp. MCBA15_008 TaxID=1898736 RepID=UPI0008DD88AA|nr:DUF6338 family protein [Curtobacterium sp. MCBA15_008]OII06955.1 hypothetical protein BIU96_05115 [Curtobacterium sp. MCBA15_008]
MPVPTSAFGVVVLVVMLVPGLVYGLVRRGLRGFQYDDLTVDARIAQALVISVALDAVYVVAGGAWFASLVTFSGSEVAIQAPVPLSLAVLVGAVGVPALLAALRHSPYRFRRNETAREGASVRTSTEPSRLRQIARRMPLQLRRTVYYDSVPTAWDWAATNPSQRLVRVRLADGRFVGGFFGPGSYVSTYPEPRDLYLSHQYQMNDDGSFAGPIPGTAGLWLRVIDDYIVEFLEPPYTATELQETQDG